MRMWTGDMVRHVVSFAKNKQESDQPVSCMFELSSSLFSWFARGSEPLVWAYSMFIVRFILSISYKPISLTCWI